MVLEFILYIQSNSEPFVKASFIAFWQLGSVWCCPRPTSPLKDVPLWKKGTGKKRAMVTIVYRVVRRSS